MERCNVPAEVKGVASRAFSARPIVAKAAEVRVSLSQALARKKEDDEAAATKLRAVADRTDELKAALVNARMESQEKERQLMMHRDEVGFSREQMKLTEGSLVSPVLLSSDASPILDVYLVRAACCVLPMGRTTLCLMMCLMIRQLAQSRSLYDTVRPLVLHAILF